MSEPDYQELMVRAEQQISAMRGAFDQVGTLEGRGEAADGRVTAVVQPGGVLHDLVLDPRAMRLASEDLAEAVKTAVAAAQEDVQAQFAELLGSALPGAGEGLASLMNPGQDGNPTQATEQQIEDVVEALRKGIDR